MDAEAAGQTIASGDTSVEPVVGISKKAAKKAEKALSKAKKNSAREEQEAGAILLLNKVIENIDEDSFGYLPLIRSTTRTSRIWHEVSCLDEKLEGDSVWIRARLQDSRRKGPLCFVVLRQGCQTVQCIADASESDSRDMIKWIASVPLESVVDVFGTVTIPAVPIQATSQKVEIKAIRFFCVSKAAPELPFQLKDANQPDSVASELIRVNLDTRLDNRIMDLRTIANQAIFRVQSDVGAYFREFLSSNGFIEIHSPKLIGGASEGGANCFSLAYFGKKAFLAQSPQLYKQMALMADMDRVFEIGPVFRAENSNTHRHLCEFVGVDMEMTFKEHYFEVVDVIDEMFQYVFSRLTRHSGKDISCINTQHAAEPFTWIPGNTPRLTFEEGVEMLRQAMKMKEESSLDENDLLKIPEDLTEFDFSTEQEKLLGQLIKQKYNTDYYILVGFPSKVRPFYTMPSAENPKFSNSYDFFMRGEEILSGAQRIHEPEALLKRTAECGVPAEDIKPYVNAFKYGSYPHAGCGIGLERVVMLYLGLPNIRKVSLFPRDPKRLNP